MEALIRTLPFFDKLSEEEKEMVRTTAVLNQYQAGIYLLGDCSAGSCLGLLHIASGELRAFLLSEEGREITLFRLSPGDNCVLSASCVLSQITFDTQLCVTKDAEILMIPSAVFGKLIKDNVYVRCFAFELATKRFSSAMWVMEQILFFGYDKRLAHFLLSEYEKHGKKELRMTQEEIAQATNSAREVVARMLKQFAGDGILDAKRGVITLKDISALKNLTNATKLHNR